MASARLWKLDTEPLQGLAGNRSQSIAESTSQLFGLPQAVSHFYFEDTDSFDTQSKWARVAGLPGVTQRSEPPLSAPSTALVRVPKPGSATGYRRGLRAQYGLH